MYEIEGRAMVGKTSSLVVSWSWFLSYVAGVEALNEGGVGFGQRRERVLEMKAGLLIWEKERR